MTWTQSFPMSPSVNIKEKSQKSNYSIEVFFSRGMFVILRFLLHFEFMCFSLYKTFFFLTWPYVLYNLPPIYPINFNCLPFFLSYSFFLFLPSMLASFFLECTVSLIFSRAGQGVWRWGWTFMLAFVLRVQTLELLHTIPIPLCL